MWQEPAARLTTNVAGGHSRCVPRVWVVRAVIPDVPGNALPFGLMPELRHDDLHGRAVVVAPERGSRPFTALAPAPGSGPAACPFCPAHEHETPPEVARTGDGAPDTPGWRIRVVPNKFPIVGPGPASDPDEVTGAHEVVILDPGHETALGDLTAARVAEVLTVLRDRSAWHLAAGRVQPIPFVNQGREAGASLEHPHAQLVVLDRVPPAVAGTLARAAATEGDLVDADLARAVAHDLVVRDGDAPVWCPWASDAGFGTVIAHRDAGHHFDEASDAHITAVGDALHDTLQRLRARLGRPPYNVVVHTAPRDAHIAPRWHIELRPRLGQIAGFELGSGLLVNVIAPEHAAAGLRDARP